MFSIKLKNVAQQFCQQNASLTLFQGVDLTLEQGRSLSITGPSGCGKTSLLLVMAGLEAPSQGKVLVEKNGHVYDSDFLRQISGFVFQQFHLLSELSAIDNVALPLQLEGQRDAKEQALHWLQQVGLEQRANHYPTQLSGGEQQRVALARAFARRSPFIFADEPTGNLDPHTSEVISQLLFELCDTHNKGLILVTHNPELAKRAHSHCTLVEQQLLWNSNGNDMREAIA